MSQPKTASRSIQPFLRTPQQSLLMFFNGAHNCPFFVRDLDPYVIHGSWIHPSQLPRTASRSIHPFCTANRSAGHMDIHTDTQTTLRVTSVAICHIYAIHATRIRNQQMSPSCTSRLLRPQSLATQR